MTVSQPPLRFGITALFLANICLAFGPMFVRLSDTGPVAAGFWRLSLAVPFLFLLSAITGGPTQRLSRPLLALFFFCGLFFAADIASWHVGLHLTKLANSNLLSNAASFLLPVYGFVMARHWPSRSQGLALAMAAAGAGLLMGHSFELSPANFTGDLLCLLAGIFYTFYLVLLSRARDSLSAWRTLAWASATSVLPLLLLALYLDEKIMPADWTPLIALAFFSQIAGQGLLTYAVGRVSPMVLGIMLLTQPALSVAIDWFYYHEALSPADLAGVVLIAVALILVRRQG